MDPVRKWLTFNKGERVAIITIMALIVLLVLACLVHLTLAFILTGRFSWWALLWLAPILLYAMMVFVDSLIKNKNLKVALLSVPAAYCQLFGYGLGFIGAFSGKNGHRKRKNRNFAAPY